MKLTLKHIPLAAIGATIVIGLLYAAAPFVTDKQPTGWVSPPTISSFNFASGTETIYRPYFNKADWSGNLFAFPIDSQGNVDVQGERWGAGVGLSSTGGAAAVLATQNYDTGRKIVTVKANGDRIAFRWGLRHRLRDQQ